MPTWDATLPANATKIRAAPQLIQNNWGAIEQASASFRPIALNLAKQAVDPAVVANTVTIFSKENAAAYLNTYVETTGSNSNSFQVCKVRSFFQAVTSGAGSYFLFDFNGYEKSYGLLRVFKATSPSTSRGLGFVTWNGVAPTVDNIAGTFHGSVLSFSVSGTQIFINVDSNSIGTISWYYDATNPEQ